jgi:hypothetical protein
MMTPASQEKNTAPNPIPPAIQTPKPIANNTKTSACISPAILCVYNIRMSVNFVLTKLKFESINALLSHASYRKSVLADSRIPKLETSPSVRKEAKPETR